MADETTEFTIEGPDGTDELTLPTELLEMLAEGGESPEQVVGDLAAFGCAQRVHATVHHAEGEADPETKAVESTMMELFEERFGASFGELTGHQH